MADVQSLTRGLSILEALAASKPDGTSLQQIAEVSGLSPSTTHRLLSTLCQAGYVVKSPAKGRYLLGIRIIAVARTVQHMFAHLRIISKPYLEALAIESGETAYFVVLDGRNSVYLDQAESPRALRMSMQIGSTFPANTSASAKAILAFQNHEDALRLIFSEGQVTRFTRRTIVDINLFRKDLQAARECGYAIEREEVDDGISCIAAPILNPSGYALAAISIPGPTTRILGSTPARLGELIVKYTNQITDALRHGGRNAKITRRDDA